MNKHNDNVIYDRRMPTIQKQHKPKRNKLFIFLIFLFFLMILLLIYFQSPFSKIKELNVEGHQLLTREQVLAYAQLDEGLSFYNFSTSTVQERLEERVEVHTARVERTFPNQVSIIVEEHRHIAFWYQEQKLYPIIATGHILLQREWQEQRVQYPILSGWPNKEGVLELSQELNKLPATILETISEINLTPIVSDPYRLTLYMDDGNEVRTSIRKFAEHVSWYPSLVEQRRSEGLKSEGIYHLFDGKWYEDPAQTIDNSEEDPTE
ncbi:cell division protein FtsQ/DivIB [Caldalkalibacillus salinus]|uniref:cell division protein FtsQ/DivIB n=1 Tax=Caldalkalibacillus salinus TaxID=2803787 RepID=UPI0019211FC2|nr:FtsQ-type POTRA domain-containing protein [Caldalkalibacillus salinus]